MRVLCNDGKREEGAPENQSRILEYNHLEFLFYRVKRKEIVVVYNGNDGIESVL